MNLNSSESNCRLRNLDTALMDLLLAIQKGDIKTYLDRVSDQVSCFEPESRGHLLRGIGLHRFLVERTSQEGDYHIELVDPLIRVDGNMAFAAYTLHLTEMTDQGEKIHVENVTRIFHQEDGSWKMIHFHRSFM